MWRWLELLVLCVGIPSAVLYYQLAAYLFPILWGLVFYIAVVLKRQRQPLLELSPRQDVAAFSWHNLRPILMRWMLASVGIALFTWWYAPDKLFFLPREHPQILPLILVFYPLLSALPQEYIFCRFFMWRYRPLFPTQLGILLASAVAFAYAHMLFLNWIAPTFSFIGGLIFGYTYMKTRSVTLVTFEHGLYGISLFTIGLGWYFWRGAIGQ